MKKIFGILIVSLCIAILAIELQMKSIVAFLGILYVIYCYKNTRICFWITYFIILAMPISKNKILEYISFEIAGKSINILQLMVILLFLVIVVQGNKNRRYKLNNMYNISAVVIVALYSIYLIIGINKGYSAFGDFMMYFLQILLFYCTYRIIDSKDDIYKLMNTTVYALTLNCIFSFIMYLTNSWSIWGIEYDGGRYGGNYLTLLGITLPYAFFMFFNKRKQMKRSVIFCAIIFGAILMGLSQNRTNPIMIIISCLCILLISLKSKSSKTLFRKVFLVVAIFILCIVAVFKVGNSESEFINRFRTVTTIEEDSNMKTRINTFKYHAELIKDKPLGNGFGTLMPFVNADGGIRYEESMTVDNSYLNVGRKTGLITLILYVILILSPIKSLVNQYKLKNDTVYVALAISFVMLLFSSSIITSHAIHSYAVSTFIWVLIGYTNLLRSKEI